MLQSPSGSVQDLIPLIPTYSSKVVVDANWLAQQGAPPYALNQPNTLYVLGADVDTPGTGFVCAAANVSLDLNGHTLTYNDGPSPQVVNGDFRSDTVGSTTITGWSTSGAAASRPTIAADTSFLFDPQVLRFSNFTSASGNQVILSQPISVPEAHHTYTASVAMSMPGGTEQSSVTAQVVINILRASDGTVLAAGSNGGSWHALGSSAEFTPSDTSSVQLQIVVTSQGTTPTTVDIDHVTLTRSHDYGVVAANEYSAQFPGVANLPSPFQPGQASDYSRCRGFNLLSTRQGGTVRQGGARGFASHAVMSMSMAGPLTVSATNFFVSGDETSAIYAPQDGAVSGQELSYSKTVANNVIHCGPTMDIIFRDYQLNQVDLTQSTGNIEVTGNTFYNVPQVAIQVNTTGPYVSQLAPLIANNKIYANAIVTNGYQIMLEPTSNLKILNNTILGGPDNHGGGEGIALDVQSTDSFNNVEIAGNQIAVYQNGTREYGTLYNPGRALRVRNDAGPSSPGTFSNLYIHDNQFSAYTSDSYTEQAYAVWLSFIDSSGNSPNTVRFESNLDTALVMTSSSGYTAEALTVDGVTASDNVTFRGNTFVSNDIGIHIGQWNNHDVDGVVLQGNTLVEAAAGPFTGTYEGILVGYWTGAVDHLQIYDMAVQGGADLTLNWLGPGTKAVFMGSTVTVTSRHGNAPLSGVAIQAVSVSGASLFSGTTDSNGQASFPLAFTEYQQLTSDPTQITTQSLLPLEVNASYGGTTQSQSVTPGALALSFLF